MAIAKLITFGKALQSLYKELVKDIGPSNENEILMKVINFQKVALKEVVFKILVLKNIKIFDTFWF